ncbi:tetratricopeptide repeat protein [Prevotella micans]|nr:tetratricopeptide repeat protein [Prevotella micans]
MTKYLRLKNVLSRATVLTTVLFFSTVANAVSQDSLLRYKYFFLEGIRQQEMGNISASFDLLRHARDINPSAPEVYYELAGYYVDMKDNKMARLNFERAVELNPDNSTYQERLGQFYITQKEYDKAIAAYERLYVSNKARQDIIQILFQLYGAQSNYKKMIETLERFELVEGGNEQISLTKMQLYEQMGEKRKEYEELQSLVNKHPLELNYRVMLGNWLLQNNRKKEAFAVYKSVLKEEPENVAAQLSLLDYYRETKNIKMEEDLTVSLLKSRKTDKETKMTLLRHAIINGRSDGSDSVSILQLFDKVLTLPQQDADIIMLKAAYMSLLKAPQESINRLYEQAIAVEPENLRARIALIQSIWDSKDYDRIIELCKPAQEYNPEEMAFYYFQGLAQYQKRDNEAALVTLRKGISQIKKDSNPDFVADFYAIMGEILHEKGLDNDAFAAFDSCLQWKPDNVEVLNNYAYYLSVLGKDLDKAERMSYKTIKANPTSSTFLDTYAWILFQQQRYDEAKNYIEQAIKNNSELNDVVVEHVGDIFSMTGNVEKALEYWQRALQKGNNSELLKRKIQLRKYIAK